MKKKPQPYWVNLATGKKIALYPGDKEVPASRATIKPRSRQGPQKRKKGTA